MNIDSHKAHANSESDSYNLNARKPINELEIYISKCLLVPYLYRPFAKERANAKQMFKHCIY